MRNFDFFGMILGGFGRNILITVVAALLPIGVGILLSVTAKSSSKRAAIITAINVPFESILVPAAIMVCYYGLNQMFRWNGRNIISPECIVIVVLALSYLLYIPARYNKSDSFLKNSLYNSLGLFSDLFKWSFVSYMIGAVDGIGAAKAAASVTYEYIKWFLLVLLVASVILLILEAGRFAVKTFLK